MHWIVEKNEHSETTQKIIKALQELNIKYSLHIIVPIAGEILGELPDNSEKVTCYGPYSMRNYLKNYNFYPGTYDLEPFDFNMQKYYWNERMLNFDSEVLKFKDINQWPDDEVRFLRPIKDSKVFSGNIFEWKEFKEWQDKIVVLGNDYGDTLSGETLVQIASPKNIYKEFRVWVVDGVVVETSQYRENLRLKTQTHEHTPIDVINYVNNSVEIWNPHDVFVVDIALLKNGDKKIIEINTFNAAGFYKADIKKVVVAIEEMEKKKDLIKSKEAFSFKKG